VRLAESFGGRRAPIWALPLLLVAANVVWLFAFGSGSRVREADLGRRLERARSEHGEVAARLAAREALWVAATENRERAAALDRDRFATERARFTDMVRELKELAQRAGLDPGSISYPRETFEQFGLTRRSFVFAVDGSYGALRTFLNLVELSPSFLTVEQIDVDLSGNGLAVRLRLSTLFTTGEGAAPVESAAPAAAPAAEGDA
jgi:Tfp pilus assembly protein PilO